MPAAVVREGGLDHPAVVALLEEHARGMLANSPPESCHFLDLSGLRAADVTFFTAWDGDALLGCGALKQLSADHGEVKSMRTVADRLRSGAGSAILTTIIDTARARGMARLSLETGSTPAFDAAHALYARFGFVPCTAFGDYPAYDPFGQFYTLAL